MGLQDFEKFVNSGKDKPEFSFNNIPTILPSSDDVKTDGSQYSFFGGEEQDPGKKPDPGRRRKKKKRLENILAASAGVLLALVVLPLIFHKSPTPGVQETLYAQSESIPKPTKPSPEPTEPPSKPTEPAPTQPAADQSFYYFRSLLSGDDQVDYDTILQAVRSFAPQITEIRAKTPEQLWRTYTCVWRDHPELFWMGSGSGSCSYDSEGVVSLNMNYTMSRADAVQYQAKLEAKVAPLLNRLAPLSEYEKVLGVYEYLVDNSIYERITTSPSTAIIVLSGRGRCADYAVATTYLLNRLGMQSIYVTGDAGSPGDMELHAWNIVRVNGNYYQVDTTWGDPVMEDGSQSINYGYLCLTTEEMSRDHYMDSEYPYPSCTDPSLGYYRMMGRYVETYDEQALSAWLSQCSPDNIDVTFQCATEKLAETYKTQLYTNQQLWRILEKVFPNDHFGTMYWNIGSDGRIFSITGKSA